MNPPRPLESITLRPYTIDGPTAHYAAVVAERYPGGYVVRVVHHRTPKWHASQTIPVLAPDGWVDLATVGPGHATKTAAIASLG